jgi:tetratricopeptide (TPR) repeat protein
MASFVKSLIGASAALFLHQAAGEELGEAVCGALANPVGPFDYYSRDREAMRLLDNVQFNHFNQDVRNLKRGQTAADVMADLDYVLRAFPNHPEALMLVVRYQDGGGSRGKFRTPECYFDRAKRFIPGDPVVHMLYAIRLARKNENERALAEYEAALEISPDYVEAHYNIGLLLVKLGRLVEAREHAKKAYAGGYPLDGLRRQLQRLNAWDDTPG